MTDQEKQFFDALVKDREENSRVLEKASMRGVKRTVVEKYSDQAHFIYELLQNADDAGAVYAEFILTADKLLFKHNGTRKFTISTPATEDDDTENGTLGDINSITSVANSNKTEATIGKFGVGFKAVFQYTDMPSIFDGNVSFRIKDFISLESLDCDHLERKDGETLFEFPFDKAVCSPSKAFNDISQKLLALNYPTLFLSNLKEVRFKFGETAGSYEKKITEPRQRFGDISVEWLDMIQPKGKKEKLLLFTREDKDNGRKYSVKYSVGFFLDDKNHLTPVDKPAFCFFPTKRVTKLKFIIHAPFLLTDSREGILAGDNHNEKMIDLLAELAADSFVCLRDLGFIDDGILDIIPVKESDFAVTDEISLKPVFKAVKEKMLTEEILPARTGYVSAENACWADALHLTDIISDEQLGELVGNPKSKWVFVTVNKNNADSNIKKYFSDISSFTEDKILAEIDEDFIESQSIEWLHKFYKWLSERSSTRIQDAKSKPIFLDANHNATAAIDSNGKPLIFMPTANNIGAYPTICAELLQNPETAKFLTGTIGIKEPSHKDMIINKILPLYKNHSITPANEADYFKVLFDYYKQCPHAESGDYINDLKAVIYLRNLVKDFVKPYHEYSWQSNEKLYMPETAFIEYFTKTTPECFLDKEFYLNLVGDNEETRLAKFFRELGVVEEIHYLYDKITLLYKNKSVTNDENHFKIIFHYYKNPASWDKIDYVGKFKEHIRFRRCDGKLCVPKVLYQSSPALVEYFAAGNEAPFLDIDFYWNLVGDKDTLSEFFKEFGIAEEVRYFEGEFDATEAEKRKLPFPEKYNWMGVKWQENGLHCSVTIAKNIAATKNAEKSFILWRRLIAVNDNVGKLADNIKTGHCLYFYRKERTEPYETSTLQNLRKTPWLVDKKGNFKSPVDITVDEMATEYDVTAVGAGEVIEFFNIDKNSRLTEDERRDLDLMKRLKDAGLSETDIEKIIADKLNAKSDSSGTDKNTGSENNPPAKPQKLVAKKIHKPDGNTSPQPAPTIITDDVEPDADDLTPAIVDYGKKLARTKAKSDAEQAEIQQLEELQQQALSAEKYSFAWFKAILELEILNSNDKNSGSKEISISFGRVEFDAGTQRTLILKYPSRYIPQFVEELENIPLVLQTANTAKTVEIEVAAVRNYTLSVKLKETQKLNDINLNDVVEATITAKNPVFLLEKLREEFSALDFDDNDNLRDKLCENIEFVFGPPGTGKTYNLSKKIIELMKEPANKILVLTPTNKAADVIVNKIIELDKDKFYADWLLRFGTTNDPNIEKSGVFHDKTFDIHSKLKNVTVTTIARFPYDFFITSGGGNLRDIDWDYIIIDEASMIMLVQIILPLYKKKPKKFIIAGDPFQIQPVTGIDLWKNENIYTLIELNSFDAPKTRPHNYHVEFLETQYRSVPAIGNIFSNFAYKGMLKHARKDSEQRPLNINDWLEVQTLNIIKFPVSKYESIYRSRRLGGTSSYQIYSALFAFEFVRELSGRIDKEISIGVIAPYRAQADLIEKLFASAKLNIPTGTVHTFQGDECDILIAVFNAPPTISSSPEMFLNRLNIINVAISRARDYLFIIMPDDNTDKIENLRLVKYVENLFAWEGYGEFAAQDIETLIFGSSNYLEENSFTTGHQSVNVYGKLERKYEIRSEENAVDVQLHEDEKKLL